MKNQTEPEQVGNICFKEQEMAFISLAFFCDIPVSDCI